MALYSGVVPIFMHLINTMKQYHKKKKTTQNLILQNENLILFFETETKLDYVKLKLYEN